MTNDLERTFFDTFGIEPKNISTGECKYKITPEFCESDCLDCKNAIKEATYPQITDRILLELICIYNVFVRMDFYSSYVKDLKIEVLETLIKEYKNRKQTGAFDENLKEKVQALFKEER